MKPVDRVQKERERMSGEFARAVNVTSEEASALPSRSPRDG